MPNINDILKEIRKDFDKELLILKAKGYCVGFLGALGGVYLGFLWELHIYISGLFMFLGFIFAAMFYMTSRGKEINAKYQIRIDKEAGKWIAAEIKKEKDERIKRLEEK